MKINVGLQDLTPTFYRKPGYLSAKSKDHTGANKRQELGPNLQKWHAAYYLNKSLKERTDLTVIAGRYRAAN